jgi:hypothetical protein
MATSKSEVPSFEVIADRFKNSCKRLEGQVEPCGDWPRLLLFGNQDGCNLELLDEYLTGDPRSDNHMLTNGLIPQLARRVNANIAGVAFPGWFADPRANQDWRKGGNPFGHPPRRECLNVVLVEANRAAAWMAIVKRHPRQSPKLSKWIGPGETGGPLVEALRRGVRAKT